MTEPKRDWKRIKYYPVSVEKLQQAIAKGHLDRETLSSAYMYLGEDNYILSKDGKVYDNIFVQSNYCDNIILTSDNTAMVKLNNERDNLSCVICLAAYVNPPSKNLSIKQCR